MEADDPEWIDVYFYMQPTSLREDPVKTEETRLIVEKELIVEILIGQQGIVELNCFYP